MAKISSSLWLLEKWERDWQHFGAIFVNSFVTDIAALAVYHFVFFAFCMKQRYEQLQVFAEEYFCEFEFRKTFADSDRNNKFIDDLALLHSTLADVLEKINATLSKQVCSEFVREGETLKN